MCFFYHNNSKELQQWLSYYHHLFYSTPDSQILIPLVPLLRTYPRTFTNP